MPLYTDLSKKEYLEELKSKTTSGSPNLAAGPWVMVSWLTTPKDKKPFYGIVSSQGFELVRNPRDFIQVVGVEGEIDDDGEKTVISTKIVNMVFPLILYSAFFATIIILAVGIFWQSGDFISTLIPLVFGLIVLPVVLMLYRWQAKEVMRLLVAKTSANED